MIQSVECDRLSFGDLSRQWILRAGVMNVVVILFALDRGYTAIIAVQVDEFVVLGKVKAACNGWIQSAWGRHLNCRQ